MQCDYVIVGAGTAGCVLANRLSADPANEVVLLEAGGKDNYFWINIPVGYLYTINNPRTDWCFQTEVEPGLANRAIGYARGRVLGGCSSINGMIYMRGQASDYDLWAQLGNRGWSWDDVLPVFKKSEDYQHGADDYHGAGGELPVSERRVNWEVLDAWREAAAQCGVPKIAEFNRGDNHGNAYFQMNQRSGVRWNANKSFLQPVAHRPNLRVVTNATTQKITFSADNDRQANGVQVRTPKEQFNVTARRGVILAAGSIGSPQLLELSGVGSPEVLAGLGIDVRHALPGIGSNLQDHLQIRTIYKVHNTTTLNRRANSLFGKAKMAFDYAVFRRGPLTMPPSQLGAFAKSDESQPSANIEWHVQPLSLDKFGEPLHPFDAITPSVCNLRPTSRGSIHARSPNIDDQPVIRLNYLSTPEDQRVAVEGLQYTRRIMAAEPLRKYAPEEWRPGKTAESEEDLLQAARELGTTIFHPVGTCKMGQDPQAVVSDRLRVHGLEKLWVIDASIMPTVTSGNTNAPTVMIAEKGAQFVLEDS